MLVVKPVAAQEIDADTREWARKLGYRGVEAYQRGDFGTAAEKLEKAFKILAAPSLGLWSARTFEKLGWLVEAAGRYREVTKLQPIGGEEGVQRKALQDAAAELKALEPRIPVLAVLVEGASASSIELELDNNPFPPAAIKGGIPANPGAHRLVARRGDYVHEETLALRESEHRQVVLHFSPSLEVRPSASDAASSRGKGASGTDAALLAMRDTAPDGSGMQRTAGWVAIGAGGAAIVVGAVTGVMALRNRDTLASDCDLDTNRCVNAPRAQVERYNQQRTFSSIGLFGGAVLAGAGVVLVLTAPRTSKQVAVHIAPDAVVLGTSF